METEPLVLAFPVFARLLAGPSHSVLARGAQTYDTSPRQVAAFEMVE